MTEQTNAASIKEPFVFADSLPTTCIKDFGRPDQQGGRFGYFRNTIAAALVTVASGSAVLGSTDPWVNFSQVQNSVALGYESVSMKKNITLGEARQLALSVAAKTKKEYARLAESEAQVERFWEEIG